MRVTLIIIFLGSFNVAPRCVGLLKFATSPGDQTILAQGAKFGPCDLSHEFKYGLRSQGLVLSNYAGPYV